MPGSMMQPPKDGLIRGWMSFKRTKHRNWTTYRLYFGAGVQWYSNRNSVQPSQVQPWYEALLWDQRLHPDATMCWVHWEVPQDLNFMFFEQWLEGQDSQTEVKWWNLLDAPLWCCVGYGKPSTQSLSLWSIDGKWSTAMECGLMKIKWALNSSWLCYKSCVS